MKGTWRTFRDGRGIEYTAYYIDGDEPIKVDESSAAFIKDYDLNVPITEFFSVLDDLVEIEHGEWQRVSGFTPQ